jgi:hypothetical protein
MPNQASESGKTQNLEALGTSEGVGWIRKEFWFKI